MFEAQQQADLGIDLPVEPLQARHALLPFFAAASRMWLSVAKAPYWKLLKAARCLPSSVLGPVDFLAAAWLAARRLAVMVR
ncbi:MAG: hypothetical protein ACRD3D_10620 [Terriglobia bacterium]